MRVLGMALAVGVAALVALPVRADTALTEPGAPVAIAEETAKVWRFASPEPGTGRVLLSWEARIDAKRASGHREFMRVTLNGEPVRPRIDRLRLRLINKPDRFLRDDGEPYFWYRQDAEGWIVVFAPDFAAANRRKRYRFGGHAYDTVVDVTDLVQPHEVNVLEIRNLTTHAYVRKWRPDQPATLFVRNLKVTVDPGPPAAERDAGDAMHPPDWQDVRVTHGAGGFTVSAGARHVAVDTRCSFPDGGWNTLNARPRAEGDEPAWRVTASPDQGVSRAGGDFYRIERTVRREGTRIDIDDRFTNVSAADRVGIIVEHRLRLGSPMPGSAWIGGSPNPSLNQVACPQNPTLFVPGIGLGLVLRDDVFRVQGALFYDADSLSVGVRTDAFAVDKGASYTLRWSLYGLPSTDYFDFINCVRRDWNVNTTVDGPYAWHQARTVAGLGPERLRDLLPASGVKHLCLWSNPSAKEVTGKPYVAIGASAFLPEIDAVRGGHLAKMKAAVDAVHAANADTKVLLMTNCFLNSVADAEGLAEFEDSWYRNRRGKIMAYRGDERLFPTYLIYPTPGNAWGRRFAKMVDYFLDECGADGIYWDEMTAWGADRKITFGEWDGHSAEIDPETKRIGRVFGFVTLLSAEYRRREVERIQARGKMVHANGAPEVTTLQTACDSRMVETKFVPVRVSELHLTTPLAYTYGIPDMAKLRERLERGVLCFRGSVTRPSPVMTRLFPFTTEELHAGWIRAKERLVTRRRDVVAWPAPFRARVWRFDAKGKLVEENPPTQTFSDDRLALDIPRDGLVIVERRTNDR